MENHLHWLGWKVRDKVTGFEGVVATVGVDLYGCVQAAVTPPATIEKSSGVQKMEHGHWFDLTRLEKVGKKPVMARVMPREHDAPGGYDKPTQ